MSNILNKISYDGKYDWNTNTSSQRKKTESDYASEEKPESMRSIGEPSIGENNQNYQPPNTERRKQVKGKFKYKD